MPTIEAEVPMAEQEDQTDTAELEKFYADNPDAVNKFLDTDTDGFDFSSAEPVSLDQVPSEAQVAELMKSLPREQYEQAILSGYVNGNTDVGMNSVGVGGDGSMNIRKGAKPAASATGTAFYPPGHLRFGPTQPAGAYEFDREAILKAAQEGEDSTKDMAEGGEAVRQRVAVLRQLAIDPRPNVARLVELGDPSGKIAGMMKRLFS